MLHPNRPFNYSSARRHWRYAEWRCGSETHHAGEVRRPASAGFEEALVLQWMQPDSPDVLSVIIVRAIFVAVVCWTTAVETEDAQRLVKKSRGCCWLTASHPGGGGGTEDAAEKCWLSWTTPPTSSMNPKHTEEQLQRQTDSKMRTRSLFLPAAIKIIHACNLCICPWPWALYWTAYCFFVVGYFRVLGSLSSLDWWK